MNDPFVFSEFQHVWDVFSEKLSFGAFSYDMSVSVAQAPFISSQMLTTYLYGQAGFGVAWF